MAASDSSCWSITSGLYGPVAAGAQQGPLEVQEFTAAAGCLGPFGQAQQLVRIGGQADDRVGLRQQIPAGIVDEQHGADVEAEQAVGQPDGDAGDALDRGLGRQGAGELGQAFGLLGAGARLTHQPRVLEHGAGLARDRGQAVGIAAVEGLLVATVGDLEGTDPAAAH